ncbi:THAP domain-containing protein 1 [Plakobranchus ocellatus]|uniref:THAP domain-containing protein 1 n=1 Tax=Plakobranchus ocellatus TaxID=259542 RepID=A0AAV4E0Z8_9GAST|nr:THAP domain-containing protein 1 [Plakobranchus ocellatus]
MGRHCAAIGCTNSDDKNKTLSLGLTFHAFPIKRPLALKAWEHAVKRKDFKPTKYSFLCSEHFKEDDFQSQPLTVHNKVILGFQALRQARAPVAGLEPATEGSLQISERTSKPLCYRRPPIHKDIDAQTSLTRKDINKLEDQVKDLETEKRALREKLERGHCSVLTQKESSFRDLCGLTKDVFT